MEKITAAALKTTVVILALILGLAAVQLWTEILLAVKTLLFILISSAALAALLGLGLGLIFFLDHALNLIERFVAWYRTEYFTWQHDRIRLISAHAAAEKDRLMVITAHSDEQVFIGHPAAGAGSLTFNPAHLLPGSFGPGPETNGANGANGASKFTLTPPESEPSNFTLTTWDRYHAHHARRSPRAGIPPASSASSTPNPPQLLPAILPHQRLIIAGNPDSGKTTLLKHLVANRPDHQIIPIDPHSPSKLLGYDVIGAGRDFPAIQDALESLVTLLSSRYNDIAAGSAGYFQHKPVTITIDEWTTIRAVIASAGDYLRVLLTESRKVNINIVLIVHSLTVEAVGVDAQIMRSATRIQLTGSHHESRRAYMLRDHIIAPDGKRQRPAEYLPPGPFPGYAQPQLVIKSLPDHRVLKAEMMHAEGKSINQIAKEFFDVKNPNKRQRDQIVELLQRSKHEAQTTSPSLATDKTGGLTHSPNLPPSGGGLRGG